MRLVDYTEPGLIFILRGQWEKHSFLQRLVLRVKQQLPEVDHEILLARLIEREEQVTTGIGHGVAIPHATVEGLDHTRCVIVQIPDGIDYESLDASPVRVAFLLLSPPHSTGVHLRLLARIARLVESGQLILDVARASDPEQIFEAVEREDRRHV